MKNPRLCLLLLLPALFAQTPPPAATPAAPAAPAGPTEEQQAKIVSQIREAALAWESKVGEITCNRTGRLEGRIVQDAKAPAPKTAPKKAAETSAAKADPRSNPKTATSEMLGPWETLQMTEDRIAWADHKEVFAGLRGNAAAPVADAGHPAAQGKNAPKPAAPLLEPATIADFTGLLKGIFAENAGTEFTWKGLMALRGIPVFALEYKVPKESSTQELVAGASRVTVAYHGTIYADTATHRVMSASFFPEAPPDFPEQDVQRVYDFGQVVIAGQFNLLPIKCQMQVRCSLDMLQSGKTGGKSPQIIARMTTDFLSFHKYFAPAVAAH